MEYLAIGLVIFFILLIILTIGVSIMTYIFNGIGLMEMAKKKKIEYYWLSWIPYASQYLMGKLAYGTNKGGIFFLCANIVTVILSFSSSIIGNVFLEIMDEEYINMIAIPLIICSLVLFLVFIAYMVFYYITIYKLYKQFSQKAVIMLVFTILTSGFMAPIFIFAIRKNQLCEEYIEYNSNKV